MRTCSFCHKEIEEGNKKIDKNNWLTTTILGIIIAGVIYLLFKNKDELLLIMVTNLAIGIFNLIPILPLDGGKILFLLLEFIRRKPLKEEFEMKATLISLSFLITFAIFITVKDIVNIF